MTVNSYSCVPKVLQNSPGVDMLKKKRNAVQGLNISGAEEPVNNDSDSSAGKSTVADNSSPSLWQSLGKFQRLAIVGFGLLLVSVAVGATGLGNKLFNTFTGGEANNGNQLVTNNSHGSTLNPVTTGTPQLSKEYYLCRVEALGCRRR